MHYRKVDVCIQTEDKKRVKSLIHLIIADFCSYDQQIILNYRGKRINNKDRLGSMRVQRASIIFK